MRIAYKNQVVSGAAAVLLMAAVSAPLGAQPLPVNAMTAEPARWTQEDVTSQQKFSTANKEAVAAQQQSLDACNAMVVSQRQTCVAQARMRYSEDMAALHSAFKK